MNAIKRMLTEHGLNQVTFFIGNGVNRASGIMPSWIYLLESIIKVPFKSEGLTYTEMYDIIELSKVDYKDLKKRVADKLIFSENSPFSF